MRAALGSWGEELIVRSASGAERSPDLAASASLQTMTTASHGSIPCSEVEGGCRDRLWPTPTMTGSTDVRR